MLAKTGGTPGTAALVVAVDGVSAVAKRKLPNLSITTGPISALLSTVGGLTAVTGGCLVFVINGFGEARLTGFSGEALRANAFDGLDLSSERGSTAFRASVSDSSSSFAKAYCFGINFDVDGAVRVCGLMAADFDASLTNIIFHLLSSCF